MSTDLVTLSSVDSEDRALELMREHHIRRIPILEGTRPVGVVTLDDLLIGANVDPLEVSKAVEAQLGEAAPGKPAGVSHPTRGSVRISDQPSARSQAHAEQTLQQFSARLSKDLGMSDADQALAAFEVVASLLVRRITPGEAQDFASQLPSILRETLLDLPAGPDKGVTLDTIEDALSRRLDLDLETAASLLRRVAGCLDHFVSSEEVGHLVEQLPKEMKQVFSPVAPD